jgi:hypothetical protein
MDVRAGLAAELKRLVRDGAEWPVRDRRRFRNLLLDATTSDALPLAELLLRVHDDGLVSAFPDRAAGRSAWESATARLASDLQLQRFVEPGVARFVAEAWAAALGPDQVASARAASPRAAAAPRAPARSSSSAASTAAAAQAQARAALVASANTAASMKAYRQSNILLLAMGGIFTVFTIFAFRSTGKRADAPPPAPTTMPVPVTPVPDAAPAPATVAGTPNGVARDTAPARAAKDSATPSTSGSAPSSVSPAPRRSVVVSPAPPRTTDDIVLNAGRVFAGHVISVRQQTVQVKDDETGLEFEINKSDIDRIVTRDGRIMRFGEGNVPLLGDDRDLTPVSWTGRYRVRYAQRWGADRSECSDVARTFAPGADMQVQHLRGAPMLKLTFAEGQGFNASVSRDGLFESGADVAPDRGPRGSFVTTRLSGRLTRAGVLQGVARLSAVMPDGAIICDLALTMRGEREP